MNQSKTKKSFGVLAITTLVFMVATTIGSAVNNAEAREHRGNSDGIGQRINQPQDNDQVQRNNVIGVQVGNVGVAANVAVPVQANVCDVNVLSGDRGGATCTNRQ